MFNLTKQMNDAAESIFNTDFQKQFDGMFQGVDFADLGKAMTKSNFGESPVAKLFDNPIFRLDTGSNYPPFDLVKYEDGVYALTFAVAGFDKKDLSVETEDGVLRVSGDSRTQIENVDNGVFITKGIGRRKFERSFSIPKEAKIESVNLEGGLLKVTVSVEEKEDVKSIKHEIA